MTLTIDMPDELPERVRATADARGQDLNAFALTLLRSAALEPPFTKAPAKRGPLPWNEFAARMVEGMDPNQPPLPDYALSREYIYED